MIYIIDSRERAVVRPAHRLHYSDVDQWVYDTPGAPEVSLLSPATVDGSGCCRRDTAVVVRTADGHRVAWLGTTPSFSESSNIRQASGAAISAWYASMIGRGADRDWEGWQMAFDRRCGPSQRVAGIKALLAMARWVVEHDYERRQTARVIHRSLMLDGTLGDDADDADDAA